MNTEPTDLDRAALTGVLRRHWSIDAWELSYMAVGFGAHHWSALADGSQWFVTAHDLRAGRNAARPADEVVAELDRAFRTAAALRDNASLEFVLAPVASDAGTVVRLGERYAIRVEPYVDGTSAPTGDFAHADERRQVATLLGRLHAAAGSVPPGLPRREDFALQGREALEVALAELGTAWTGGPFTGPAQDLLRAHAEDVRRRLHAYDRLARQPLGSSTSWVVTHGEPHSANVVREPAGSLCLVDWDTALTAPPERDLWMVLDDDLTGWDEYCETFGPAELDDQAMRLYRERWALEEICEYTSAFRRPHSDTADTREAWAELREYLPGP